jgi:uncharacterized protein YlzI (FlbEa/FlbD family)
MIKLTRRSGEIEIVNPDMIERITEVHADSGSRIIFPDGESYPYKESPAEVAHKVLEWRLAIIRYQTAVEKENRDDITFEKWNLKQLSGLEE